MFISDNAIEILATQFGGVLTHDSGHTKTAPTLIYTFPRFGGYQIAIRKNKNKLTAYLNAKSRLGNAIEKSLPPNAIEERYPNDHHKNPSNSLLSEVDAPFLSPRRNKLLRVNLPLEKFAGLISLYLDADNAFPSPKSSKNTDDEVSGATHGKGASDARDSTAPSKSKRKISLNELEDRLARQREIGAQGEEAAFRYECARLHALGCDNPVVHIEQLSNDDVGAGYDLRSTFNGSMRCIEVKASVNSGDSFFLSENERKTLAELGSDAYLYRVLIDSEDSKNSKVVQEIQNPMGSGKLELEAVAYKATVIGLAGSKEPD